MVSATNTIITCENEQDWLAQRRVLGLGGSESSAALGHNDFCTRWKLWAQKTNLLPFEDETIPMMVGKALEGPIRILASRELGAEIINPGSYTIRRSPEHEHLFCTLDGLVPECDGAADLFARAGLEFPGGEGIAQIKAVNAFASADWSHGEWPLMYQIQTQHELICAGLKWGVVPVLIGNHKFQMVPFVENKTFQEKLIAHTADFWQMVLDRIPPAIDGSDATTEAIKRAFRERETEGPTVDLPADSDAWAEALKQAKSDKKNAEDREAEAKNNICAAIGEASYGMTPSGKKFSWKTQTRASYVAKASTFRVLR